MSAHGQDFHVRMSSTPSPKSTLLLLPLASFCNFVEGLSTLRNLHIVHHEVCAEAGEGFFEWAHLQGVVPVESMTAATTMITPHHHDMGPSRKQGHLKSWYASEKHMTVLSACLRSRSLQL
eukprot:1532583-Amphidinium_carterae.1